MSVAAERVGGENLGTAIRQDWEGRNGSTTWPRSAIDIGKDGVECSIHSGGTSRIGAPVAAPRGAAAAGVS